jgi:hypothetical protein
MNPSRLLITGVVCGVRVEEIQEPIMREIRYLDKLIDELAKGKAMETSANSRARIGPGSCTLSSEASATTWVDGSAS